MSVNFTGQKMIAGPVNMAGGVQQFAAVFGFATTGTTFDFQVPPNSQIISFEVRGRPLQITTGSTLDAILVSNSVNASGALTLIAADTTGYSIMLPNIVRITRTGTNNQDCHVLYLKKGG